MRKLLVITLVMLAAIGVNPIFAIKRNLRTLPPYEIAILIIKKYETLHKARHYPTIGYGHVVQRGEPYRRGVQLTERQADALLRKDLKKFVAMYDHLPKYKLLLGVLAYNIGPGAVNKSSVYKKLMRGDTDIYKEYVSHCRYKGKWHRQLHNRRCLEYALLFTP
ncbi:MAG: glycoside hydrolase family protein [Muribaculum sp.]|nr:glycoside hydrolase family protein [Muribaculum sp.]